MSEEAAVAVAVAAAPAPVVSAEIDLPSALREVMKKAAIVDGLCRGLREAVKALDRKEAQFAILAKDCDEQAYKKLIHALCKTHQIPLIEVDSKLELGELAGLAKRDATGEVRKRVKCSCAVIRNFGDDSTPHAEFVKKYIAENKA